MEKLEVNKTYSSFEEREQQADKIREKYKTFAIMCTDDIFKNVYTIDYVLHFGLREGATK